MNKVIKSIPDGLEASYADELTTDLSEGTRDANSIEIQSSTGQNYVMPGATENLAGLQTAGDKVKLEELSKLGKIACVIRNDGDKSDEWNYWIPIDNIDHTPIGLQSSDADPTHLVKTSSNGITVYHDFNYSEVGSVIAAPDEKWAQRGLRIGTSVGTNSTTIQIYKDVWFHLDILNDGSILVNAAYMDMVIGTPTFNDVSGYIEVEHDEVIHGTKILGDCGRTDVSIRTQSNGYNKTRFYLTYKPKIYQGECYWNGSGWTLTHSSGITAIDLGNGKVQLVADNGQNIRVVPTALHNSVPLLSDNNPENIVMFKDYTGANITTPDGSCWFSFIAVANESAVTDLTTVSNLYINMLIKANFQTDPTKLQYVDNSNIWLLGITK